jgi:hypothetical protein
VLLSLAVVFSTCAVYANATLPTISAKVSLLKAASLGGKQLNPGDYSVKAEESRVVVMANGKEVAEASIQWKDETKKPLLSMVIVENGQVSEIHFQGKTRYAVIAQ